MRELERVAQDKGFHRLVLETGVLQASAIGLYLSEGYRSIPNFGEYAAESESRCFAKDLGPTPPPGPAHRRAPDGHAHARRLVRPRGDGAAPRDVARHRGAVPGDRRDAPRAASTVDDPQQGVGALTTVVAWIDGRPVGCATLRAARDGYPAGSAELKKVWVDESARGSGAARALLAAIEDDARAHGLTSVVLQTGIRQPEAVTLYLSAGYRPVVPFFDFAGDFLSLWMAKDV